MSSAEPECLRCKLYQTETALLRAEVASLRNAVLTLTGSRSEGPAVLEIVGIDTPQRLAIAGPFVDGQERFYRVSITHRDQLSARCEVYIADRTVFLRFFEDLAQHKGGWDGKKTVTSDQDQLAIACTYGGKGLRPEIGMEVSCALDDPTFEPYWTVQLHLDVDPESLDDVAAQARAVFGDGGGG